MSFFDQQLTNDGKPYAPIRFKQIVREAYLISKNLNTSYSDVLNMTPLERNYLLQFLVEDAQAFNKELEESKKRQEAIRKKY